MNGFTPAQRKHLEAKLDRSRVRSRILDGKRLDYIEGWFAIAEANAIFGFDGWDRELVHFERVHERSSMGESSCGYVARVRLKVRAGRTVVVREGSGWGYAKAGVWSDAHERALKAAETDATKRALATFGNRFGLSLYDRQRPPQSDKTPNRTSASQSDNGSGSPSSARSDKALVLPSSARNVFVLYGSEAGSPIASNLSPEGYCGGLKQLIEASKSEGALKALLEQNTPMLEKMGKEAPGLRNSKGLHFADVLRQQLDQRLNQILDNHPTSAEPTVLPRRNRNGEVGKSPTTTRTPNGVPLLANPSKIAIGPAIDKSALSYGLARRVRDIGHLRYVAARPCLICEGLPCHAHHLTFAQPRGLSLKVSDEFTVPLCAVHHNDLHRPGTNERGWWYEKGVNALALARNLWLESGPGRTRSDDEAVTIELKAEPKPAE